MSYSTERPEVVCDTECLTNYWSIGFKTLDGSRIAVYEMWNNSPLDKAAIAKVFRKYRVYTFNGIKYDLPMILLAMSGATNAELKKASDELILSGIQPWQFMDKHGLTVPDFIDHVDLMSVSPGAPQMPSLKIYAGRLHSKRMQEMPIEHDDWITEETVEVLRSYHGNDLDVTIDLKNDLKDQVKLRALMSDEYGVDLRSKSDAQIAEAVIKSEVERLTGRKLYRPDVKAHVFSYDVPHFIEFQTQAMRQVLNVVRNAKFVVRADGVVQMPEALKELKIGIGKSVYRMGIGGLHSSESSASHYAENGYLLRDRDVTSYYPNIIMQCGLVPKHIGDAFLKVYKRIYDRRIAAKKAGDKNTAETLKIVLNGSFGKFGSPFSVLYAPKLMIQTTITGQLALLMLIEAMEQDGMQVVSANTDGFVTKLKKDQEAFFIQNVEWWEKKTGFPTEEVEYISLHSRDVNSYIALSCEKDGKIKAKRKGDFTACGPGLPGAAGQKKNPAMEVCTDAVVAYLTNGTPIEDTIDFCPDVRKFLTVRRVTGGAEIDGMPVGKALRWYYAKGNHPGFKYIKNGNSVPQTIGAKLMMELEPLPADIDYEAYYRESYAILDDIGARYDDPNKRTGIVIGKLADLSTYHLVDLARGHALCGKRPDSRRDPWAEYKAVPSGGKLCKKCQKAQSEDEL